MYLFNSVYQAGLADHPEFVIVITRLLLNCIRILPLVLFSSYNKSFWKLFSVQSQYQPQVDPIYYQMIDELRQRPTVRILMFVFKILLSNETH